MRIICLLSVLLCFAIDSFSQSEKYSRVKIFTDEAGLKKLSGLGLAVDHGEVKKGVFFISDFPEKDIKKIAGNGFKYEILIDDVSEYYAKQNENPPTVPSKKNAANCSGATNNYTVPSDFSLGTMGGFYKYNEMLASLDSMAAKYPSIISFRQPVDTITSIEGRPVYWLKISDNPQTDEAEPEVLYTALTHAREPASLSQMIFFMWYLLENYGSNSEVTYLVNNFEMYFIPCVNPDGYIRNETTNPSGGGQWRKNRRNNGDGTYGVDINRNYGYMWGYDNSGSSPNTNDDTYRGTAAFSEPETYLIKKFCESHSFKIVLHYHTFGNDLIYPWGYIPSLTPDSDVYIAIAKKLTLKNSYTVGTGYQTVGYGTNGDSDDWGYGEQSSKPKFFSMTPEAGPGNYGFWPPSSAITGICIDNVFQNLYTAHLAGKYAQVHDLSSTIVNQNSGYFPFTLQRLGLDSPATYSVFIQPLDSFVTIQGNPKQFSNLSLLETITDSLAYSIDSSVASGQQLRFLFALNNGLFVFADTITKIYGQQAVALADSCGNLSKWTSSSWGISNTVYHSPGSSITDSPSGNYPNNSSSSIVLTNPVDLTNAQTATLVFWARWEIEGGYDYAQVSASADGGSTWAPLCGKYTKSGSADQDPGQPVYDGSQTSWVKEEISLNSFIGQNIKLRFRLASDNWVNYDGFYFDDVDVNFIPSVTTVSSLSETKTIIEIYPNPNNGKFVLSNLPTVPSQSQASLLQGKAGHAVNNESFINQPINEFRITNIFGQEVHKSLLLNPQSLIRLDLPAGIYFYKVMQGEETIGNGKLVIE